MTAQHTEGTPVAMGVYAYTMDDRPRASEQWRLTRLPGDRLHAQSIMGVGQQVLFGVDELIGSDGAVEELQARTHGQNGDRHAVLTFDGNEVRGQITDSHGTRAIALSVPPATLPLTFAVAPRIVLGRALDLSREDEQPLSLCQVPVFEENRAPLEPVLAQARATVLGVEEVELLMATVSAHHVLFEMAGHPPQHGWFDERRFPVRWYWLGHSAEGASVAHELSLTRYAWLAP